MESMSGWVFTRPGRQSNCLLPAALNKSVNRPLYNPVKGIITHHKPQRGKDLGSYKCAS
jgi:hypothetical protein